MAGPQVQHTQRPNSAYYTGVNGSGNGNASAGMASSASHTGLHALRQVSNETELIYRGSHSNGTVNELPPLGGQLSRQQQFHQHQQHQHRHQPPQFQQHGSGCPSADALIGTIATSAGVSGSSSGGAGGGGGNNGATAFALTSGQQLQQQQQHLLKKSNTQRSIEIIVDATQCGKDVQASATTPKDDIEQGGGGEGGQETVRKSSRHRHRPLHRRLITYLRNLFQGSAAQNALTTLLLAWGCLSKHSELEEFETPARYRPDSLSALSRATRFTEDEIKRIYRGFKAECPTGVVKEDTFKVIYSQFFPQGANPTLYAHYVFNTLDQDHSGIVSFEDFVQGLSILSRGSVEEKLRWTFSLYDINGDGFITPEEMTDIVTAIYELMGRLPDECPEEEKIKGKVEQIFQKMDINRDGVVTLEEFLEACRNDEAISRSMSVFESAF
ncbi:uncharacterized protein [Drosophila tropicalis]|uniref:uncharacterized protein isoform X2 n=1 Tax=Drosophila tropicalis TaxID=46794 RepID=UPI0035ABAC24